MGSAGLYLLDGNGSLISFHSRCGDRLLADLCLSSDDPHSVHCVQIATKWKAFHQVKSTPISLSTFLIIYVVIGINRHLPGH
jgi:hypothetical protein